MKATALQRRSLSRSHAGTLAAILAALLAAGLVGPAQPERAPGLGTLGTTNAQASGGGRGGGGAGGLSSVINGTLVAIPD
jgi:hypothetical protein